MPVRLPGDFGAPPGILCVVALAGTFPEITAVFPEPNTDFLEYNGLAL
jgi:hypothetical protein